MNSARRPILADVAAAAGVSRSTASRALSNHPSVNAETRERVWAAAQALDFEPNQMARSLRTRSSLLVGMLLPDVGVAAYAAALSGAQRVLEPDGYQIMAMNTRARAASASRRRCGRSTRAMSTGCLVATSGGFVEGDAPAVFFDHVLAGRGLGFATADNLGGVDDAGPAPGRGARARADRVPRRPGRGGARRARGSSTAPATERLEAFRHAMGTLRLPVVPEYLPIGRPRLVGRQAAATRGRTR